MKTTAQKLIVITMVAFLGLTANAQNTKSFKMNQKVKLAEFFSEKVDFVKHGLSAELKNLEALVRYKPEVLNDELNSSEPMNEISSVVAQLEAYVKYTPSKVSFNNEEEQSVSEFAEIQKELEKTVKFRPSETLVELNPEFDSILKELEKDVKYKPSSAI